MFNKIHTMSEMKKLFSYEDRLVRFVGECIFFSRKLNADFELYKRRRITKKRLVISKSRRTNSYWLQNDIQQNQKLTLT